MMALIMCKLMLEAGAFLGALAVCPVVWLCDGPAKAITTLIVMYGVGGMCAPTADERARFTEFIKQQQPS